MTISIVLADDHDLVREGLAALLRAENDFDVVGSVSNGLEMVKLLKSLKPDVAVIDIDMPDLNGIEATRKIKELSPATGVLILSMHSTSEIIHSAIKAGARGYLLKDTAAKNLGAAIKAVHIGRRFFSDAVTEAVLQQYIRQDGPLSPLESLSDREREILQLIAEGNSNAQAAEKLFISVKTVETYRSRLMQKLGVRDITELVKFCISHGITSLR